MANDKRQKQRQRPTALFTWGVVALVVVAVVVLVVVKLTSSPTAPQTAPPPGPVPATIVRQVTSIPASVYDAVGVTSSAAVTPPKALKGQSPLTFDGKPGVFYMGGEFCPFCAAERWAMIASFSRFGTLTGLRTMQSSAIDRTPDTQTFSFVDATFASPYLTLETREHFSNQLNSAGGYLILQSLTKAQSALVSKYDTSTTSSGSIPFIDIGNKFLVKGASYTPSILQGLSRSQIASGLSTPKDPVTQAIVASSNYISASICSADGEKPASVCTSKGVTTAAKALGLSS